MSEINGKLNCRYGVTAYLNVGYPFTYCLTVLPGIQNLDALMARYKELIALVSEEVRAKQGREQQFANLMSTLRSYLAFVGKSEDSSVGQELGKSFDETCRRYCSSLGLSRRTIRDRRSHLNKWRAAADSVRGVPGKQDLGRSRVPTPGKTAGFTEQLRNAVAAKSISAKALASAVQMSPATLTRWMRGAHPNARARPAIARIENFCGLPRGRLAEALRDTDRRSSNLVAAIEQPQFRTGLGKRIKSPYRLNPRSFSPSLVDELKALYLYKTSKRPALARSRKGVWAVSSRDLRPEQRPVSFSPDDVCVSFNDFLGILSSYLGFLCLDGPAGGMGRRPEEVQTLAWLAVPDAIDKYMGFLARRSGDLVHAGHFRLAALILNLTHPQTGYLAQQPAFAAGLPEDVRPTDWLAGCLEARGVASEWKQQATDRSRDPAKPIAALLAMPEPLQPLIRAVKELDRMAMQAPEGSFAEALHKRDALLLAMLIFNPLRIRNYVLMKVTQSRGGYIYRAGEQYRIAIPKRGFKNAKSKGVSDYDVGIQASLTAWIDDYLENYRPVLLAGRKDSELLFPNRYTGGVNKGLGRHVFFLTARLIPGSPGFGPHAIRHLVATSWLKNNPEDLNTVSELLNDRLETVIRNYAHLRKDDSLSRHAARVDELFRAMDD